MDRRVQMARDEEMERGGKIRSDEERSKEEKRRGWKGCLALHSMTMGLGLGQTWMRARTQDHFNNAKSGGKTERGSITTIWRSVPLCGWHREGEESEARARGRRSKERPGEGEADG